MKFVIVDDERLAREELRGLLEELGETGLVGEASNLAEALEVVERTSPDVLFLDIEMPGGSGFDFLARLPAPHPKVVFVTAYDAFALRAFEVNAVDYLLKPVAPLRLKAAVERFKEVEPLETPVLSTPLREDDQVYFRVDQRCWFVPVREIFLLEGEGSQVQVFHGSSKALLSRTLASMEERLPVSLFIRANRAQLVNRLFIKKVEPWFSGSVKATLANGQEIEFSRRQAREFRERLGL